MRERRYGGEEHLYRLFLVNGIETAFQLLYKNNCAKRWRHCKNSQFRSR
jgi:hypothetical protein